MLSWYIHLNCNVFFIGSTGDRKPNTKYQLKFFVVIENWKEKKQSGLFLFQNATKKRRWLIFGVYYLVFSHLLIQWKEHKYATKYLTKMLTLYLDRIQTENVFYALVRRIKCVWVAYKWSRPCRPYNSMYNTTVHCTAT